VHVLTVPTALPGGNAFRAIAVERFCWGESVLALGWNLRESRA
jgi:hypothetical protein